MSINKKDRSIYGNPPEQQKIYNQRRIINRLEQENQQLKEMIDEQDGCNKRRLQIFELKDKLCKELKEKSILKKENKQLKEEIKGLKKLYVNMASAFINECEKTNKAIEYMEESMNNPLKYEWGVLKHTLEILKGDSNE